MVLANIVIVFIASSVDRWGRPATRRVLAASARLWKVGGPAATVGSQANWRRPPGWNRATKAPFTLAGDPLIRPRTDTASEPVCQPEPLPQPGRSRAERPSACAI